jgi:hypothetical protein
MGANDQGSGGFVSEARRGGMSMATHTPGPWELEDLGEGVIRGPGGVHIALVSMESDFACLEDKERPAAQAECEANSRLIAAAPDLLAAARDALETFERRFPNSPTTVDLREVIAAAEGSPRPQQPRPLSMEPAPRLGSSLNGKEREP